MIDVEVESVVVEYEPLHIADLQRCHDVCGDRLFFV
jgi:hypothetical protein